LEDQIRTVNIHKFLLLSEGIPVVDVRSPAEHEKGCIPGSVNIALFSNSQRQDVGTVFKKAGNREAILRGLDHVGPSMAGLLRQAIELAGPGEKLLVHCWRGGMRSSSMAWLFSLAGIECYLLEGGYRAYRNHVLDSIGRLKNVIVLGGLTGSGKTDTLKVLADRGEQVIDLEGLANHRGSAFGAIGMPVQPSSEQFANLLYHQIAGLDPEKRVFIEDESHNIGSVFMPDVLYSIIRNSWLIALMSDADNRIPRLMKEYGVMPGESLVDSISRIRKRLGGQNADQAIKSIKTGHIEDAIRIVLAYYDKTYRFGLSKRDSNTVFELETDSRDENILADKVLELANKIRG
jgi:tRNA 2-selenouridine synthase